MGDWFVDIKRYYDFLIKWGRMPRTQKKLLTIQFQKNYLNVRIIARRRGNVSLLDCLYTLHEDWKRKNGSEYNKLENGLVTNGYYRRLYLRNSVHSSQRTVFTTIVEKKTNRKVLDDVPFWEVMPHLRRLSAGKIRAATPSAYLSHILSSPKFTKKVRRKWIGLLKHYIAFNYGDYLLLRKQDLSWYGNHKNAKAQDFRIMLPNMISSAQKHKNHAGQFAQQLNKLDLDLNNAKYFMKHHTNPYTFLIMRRINDFYKARGSLSFMGRGNWLP